MKVNNLLGGCILILIATVILFNSVDFVEAKKIPVRNIGGGSGDPVDFVIEVPPTNDLGNDSNESGNETINTTINVTVNVSTNVTTNITTNTTVNSTTNSSDDNKPNDKPIRPVEKPLEKPNTKPVKDSCSIEKGCIKNPVFPAMKRASFYPDSQANYIYSGSEKVLEVVGSKKTYLHNDYSKTLVLTTDSSGLKLSEYVSLPFGLSVGRGSGNFHGKDQDQSGLFYYGARYYDPITGRFTQTDKIQRSDVSPYMYSNNDPLNRLDPDGNDDKKSQKKPEGSGDELDLSQIGNIIQIRDAEDARKFAQGAALSEINKRVGVSVTAVLLPIDIWIEMANEFQESSESASQAGRVKDVLFSEEYGYALALPGLFPKVDGVATMDDLRNSIVLANKIVDAQIMIRQLALDLSKSSEDRVSPTEVMKLITSGKDLDPEDMNLKLLNALIDAQEKVVEEKRNDEEKEDENE